MMRNIYLLGLIIAMMFLSGCTQQEGVITSEKGFLEGKVAIGPICPVEPCEVSAEQMAKIFEARRIIIYTLDMKSIVKEVHLDGTGNYKTELDPGRYVVDINHVGIDRSGDVPKEIVIEPGKTVKLDIDIDTGIR